MLREDFSLLRKEFVMSRFKISIAACVIAALPALALAQATSATPGIDKRQANQERRIQQGVKSGQLTAPEAARLEKREAKIQTDKQAAMADGKVTAKERRKLQREQKRASRAIHREKHDREHK
jgi:hypothetical protein